MSHFQIFIPGVLGGDTKILDKVGLGDLHTGREICIPTDGTSGPGANGGVCIAWNIAGERRMGCQLEQQTWIPAVASHDGDAGRYYVGFWNDSPPKPEELMRPKATLLQGEAVELGDGGRWMVPCYQRLPQDIIQTPEGEYTFRPKARFVPIYELGQRWSARLIRQASDIPWSDVIDSVLMLLRLNYRVTSEVVMHLRLLDTDNALRPVLAFLGADPTLATLTTE